MPPLSQQRHQTQLLAQQISFNGQRDARNARDFQQHQRRHSTPKNAPVDKFFCENKELFRRMELITPNYAALC
jgi:hypothetical protein